MTAEVLQQDGGWWRIYEDSFPASEREPHRIAVRRVQADHHIVWIPEVLALLGLTVETQPSRLP